MTFWFPSVLCSYCSICAKTVTFLLCCCFLKSLIECQKKHFEFVAIIMLHVHSIKCSGGKLELDNIVKDCDCISS